MAKRFTDTNKYKKKFFRGLQGAYKLLWDFLYHDCDHCGIWIVDFDIAQTYVGKDMPINYEDAIRYFNERKQRIIELDGGTKWFVPMFIEFQYGSLSSVNKAHNAIIPTLKKYDLLDESLKIKKTIKPLTSPLQGDKEMVMDKELETEMDKEQVGSAEGKQKYSHSGVNGQAVYIVPEMFKVWQKYKPDYPYDKNKDFQALRQIGDFILNQEKVKRDDRPDNVKILEAFDYISNFAKEHDFFKNYSLLQLDRNIQSVVQSIQNGDTKKSKPATGGNVDTKSAFSAIDNFHAKNGSK